MDHRTVTFNRWFVAIAAIACLAASAFIAVQFPDEMFWWGSLFRAGIVLGTLWFCLPSKNRPAAWASFSPVVAALVVGVLLLTMIRPRLGLPILIGILAVRAFLTRWRSR